MERMKKHSYEKFYGEQFFWRTYGGKEIDLIETINNNIAAYEFKSSLKEVSAPSEWKKNYPKSSFNTINPDNYLSFVL